ncbi:MAG: MerR family transcriptional regulator [Dehalococcoidia bacterium]|nr:MAG: MerR family transcriptional regulator [Dehalococcoidia bacterium]
MSQRNVNALAGRSGESLLIGEAAERACVTPRTLRYYEEKGLIEPTRTRRGRIRTYSLEDVLLVRTIRDFQELLRLPLREIQMLLVADAEARFPGTTDRATPELRTRIAAASDIASREARRIKERIDVLRSLSGDLRQRMANYRRWIGEIDRREAEVMAAGDAKDLA